MRIDKYMKVTRLIKRREMAKEMLDKGMMTINGKIAKPASEIKEGDEVVLTTPAGKKLTFTVKAIKNYANIQEAETLYEMKEGN